MLNTIRRLRSSVSHPWICGVVVAAFVLGLTSRTSAAAASASAEIRSIAIQGTNIIVTAWVDSTVKTAYLESRPGLFDENWEPQALLRIETSPSQGTNLTFVLPQSSALEMLRIRGETTNALPAALFSGGTIFGTPAPTNAQSSVTTPTAAGTVATGDTTAGAAPTTGAEARDVVESDLWNLSGDTLFFFNQYRGLQVVDLTKPDAPALLGTYDLPASGEQMYLYDPTHVILLAGERCGGGTVSDTSRILLLGITNGQPRLQAELDVPGQIRESRLIGTALYVISDQYRPIVAVGANGLVAGTTWQWGSYIASFDLSRVDQPVARSTAWVSGYENAVMATDHYLFVAAPSLQNSAAGKADIHIFDVSSPDGSTREVATIHAGGLVADKFKMNLNGSVFTAVTQYSGKNLTTQVETYSLAIPSTPRTLGTLTLLQGEQLFATAFDGPRLYAVTYHTVDPLWIVDLTDPAHPAKLSELTIPGYSTYIDPLQNRLLTIGIENTNGWKTSVQWFDVADPAKPALLSKVLIGDGYTSSEANFDEKALAVLPESGLVLVPYTSYTDQGTIQGVQLIDLKTNSLVKRGIITNNYQVRRSTLRDSRIVSISGVELTTVDASDRDHPQLTSATELSWSADRLFVEGSFVGEIANSYGATPSLQVVSTTAPDQLLSQIALDNAPVLGATTLNHRLYLAQGDSTRVFWPLAADAVTGAYLPLGTNQASLVVSVYDLSQLPAVTLLGKTKQTVQDAYWSTLKPLWPEPGVLVWAGAGQNYIYYLTPAVVTTGAVTALQTPVASSIIYPGGGQSPRLLAFDVSNPAAPAFLSEVDLSNRYIGWSFSDPYTANGLIYLSHLTSEYDPFILPLATDGSNSSAPLKTNTVSPGSWVQRYYLDVVNYNNPSQPTLRKPAQIPGSLIGLSHGGELLYTDAYRYGTAAPWSDWSERLDVLGYDGLAAHLIDSMELPSAWPHPLIVSGDDLFLGRPSLTTNQPPILETWSLSAAGKLTLAGSVPLAEQAEAMAGVGDLLAVENSNQLTIFDKTNPAALTMIGAGGPDSCVWFDLSLVDGNRSQGLWLPLGAYGASQISLHHP